MTASTARRLTEQFGVVYGITSFSKAAALIDTDSVNMKNYSHATFIFAFGAITGDSILTINSGATDGTKTTAETFRYRLAGAAGKAAGADVYGAEASSAALTLTAATYQNKILVCEIQADEITDDQPFVTGSIDATANPMLVSCVILLRGPRYRGNAMPVAIP